MEDYLRSLLEPKGSVRQAEKDEALTGTKHESLEGSIAIASTRQRRIAAIGR